MLPNNRSRTALTEVSEEKSTLNNSSTNLAIKWLMGTSAIRARRLWVNLARRLLSAGSKGFGQFQPRHRPLALENSTIFVMKLEFF